MNILIVGAGAMGTLYGAKLAQAGNRVTIVTRREKIKEKLDNQGIIMDEDGIISHADVNAALATELNSSPELIILFTKTQDSLTAMASVAHLISPNTYLLSLQNGLGNEKTLLKYADSAHVLIGSSIFPSDLVEPGHVKTTAQGNTKMMALDMKMTNQLTRIGTIFNQAGLKCNLDLEVWTAIWEKVAFNCSLNCITGICQIPAGGVTRNPVGTALALEVVKEVLSVATAMKVAVSLDRVTRNVDMALASHGDHYSSMAQDMIAHKPSEVEMLCGSVIALAHVNKISVPRLETLYDLIKIIEANY